LLTLFFRKNEPQSIKSLGVGCGGISVVLLLEKRVSLILELLGDLCIV
jgi:hypothetical protein